MASVTYRSIVLTLLLLCILFNHSAAQDEGQSDLPEPNTACGIGGSRLFKVQTTFNYTEWMRRGRCIRSSSRLLQCEVNLEYVLSNLSSTRQLEYGAAATILALIPTIGALFGTPTGEIWALTRLLPFGGLLTMLLSFGGSLMTPVLNHYSSFGRQREVNNESKSLNKLQEHLDLVSSSINNKVRNEVKMTLPFYTIVAGLCVKIVLLGGVLAGIYVISIGSIFISYCMIIWWIYGWYIVVTVVTIIDSWAQLPFDHYVKLYLTDIRINYKVSDGDPITSNTNTNLKQLSTIPCANFYIDGTHEPTSARNTLLIIISIARDINDPEGRTTSASRYFIQVLARLTSLTVYVFGTVLFASTSLLVFTMAEMILMLILGAGVLSRVMASKIVQAIDRQDSMIHIIAQNEGDADKIVTHAFKHQLSEETKFQIELDGHLFLETKRITRRSIWWRRILGVLASPYDFTKHAHVAAGILVGTDDV